MGHGVGELFQLLDGLPEGSGALFDARLQLRVGGSELSASLIERALAELTLGDVASDLGRADDTALSVTNGRYRQRDVDPSPVLSDANRFVVIDALANAQASEDLGFLVGALGWNEQRNRLADHLLLGVTENALGSLVPRDHDAVQVLADDRVVRGFDDRRQPLVDFGVLSMALPQGLALSCRATRLLELGDHPVDQGACGGRGGDVPGGGAAHRRPPAR